MAAQSAAGGAPEANSREKMEGQMFDMMALDSTPRGLNADRAVWHLKPSRSFPPHCSWSHFVFVTRPVCGTVEGTLSNCASLCLHDTSIDKTARRNRARALLKLGMLFRGVAEALESQLDQRVRVARLKSRPEVNGSYGTVEGINPLNGRVHVKVSAW